MITILTENTRIRSKIKTNSRRVSRSAIFSSPLRNVVRDSARFSDPRFTTMLHFQRKRITRDTRTQLWEHAWRVYACQSCRTVNDFLTQWVPSMEKYSTFYRPKWRKHGRIIRDEARREIFTVEWTDISVEHHQTLYGYYNRFGKQTHERSSSKLSSSEIDHESLIRRYIYIYISPIIIFFECILNA